MYVKLSKCIQRANETEYRISMPVESRPSFFFVYFGYTLSFCVDSFDAGPCSLLTENRFVKFTVAWHVGLNVLDDTDVKKRAEQEIGTMRQFETLSQFT